MGIPGLNEGAVVKEIGLMDKETIRQYWEPRLPQTWYSDEDPHTKEWFLDTAHKRFTRYVKFLFEVAEFDEHKDEKVLEVGVGIGTDLVQFAVHGSRISGIDLTKNAIETTRNHLKVLDLEYEFLEQGDAEQLPFDDDTFNLVYSFGVLHHTPDTQKAIDEVHRVLKPQGKAIIMLYARDLEHYFGRILYHGILRGELFRMSYQEVVNRHSEIHGNTPLTKLYHRHELEPMFKRFSNVSFDRRGGYNFPLPIKYSDKWNGSKWVTRGFRIPGPFPYLTTNLRLDRWNGGCYIIKGYK